MEPRVEDQIPDDLPVPEWHLKLAEEGLADYRRDPSAARPAFEHLDELLERLHGRNA